MTDYAEVGEGYAADLNKAAQRFAVDLRATLALIKHEHGDAVEMAARREVAARVHSLADALYRPT